MGRWLELAAKLESERGRDNRDERAESAPTGANVPIVPSFASLSVPAAAELKQWRAGLASVSPFTPMGGISAPRWERLVRDAVQLFNGWAPQALALGWSDLDLFGVDPKLRPDHQVVHGLAWRLDCWRVHSLSENMACLVGKFGGSPGRYYRGDCSRLVPLWGLQ